MAALIGIQGEHVGRAYPLTSSDPCHLGRSPASCEVVFPRSCVSRLHATVYCERGQFYVVDKDSHNNTSVNGREIRGEGPIPLHGGETIEICGSRFRFQGDPQSAQIEPADYSSTVEISLSQRRDYLEIQSARTLAWLIKLTAELPRAEDITASMSSVLDRLFELFQKADRVLLFLRSTSATEGDPYLAQSRTSPDCESYGFSQSLIQDCLSTGNGIVAETVRQLDADRGAESCITHGIHSVTCAPLQGRNGACYGALQLDTRSTKTRFNQSDLQILMAVAQHLGMVFDQAEDQRALVELEKVKRDLEVARTIQRALLPTSQPDFPEHDIVGFYEPAREVGGDYYDLLELEDGRIAILQGDVAGKGIPAALFMARMSAAAAYAIQSESNLSSAFRRLNQLACELSGLDRFVTMIAAILDPEEHTLTFANAGHNLPLLVSGTDGTIQEIMGLGQCGLPLGIVEDATYSEWTIHLHPGDSVLMFTDGVTDTRSPTNGFFGIGGIKDALQNRGSTAQELVDCLVQALAAHQQTGDSFDDTTITCVGRKASVLIDSAVTVTGGCER